MKTALIATGLSVLALSAQAEAEKYVLDSSHSQIVFSYQHLGFSTSYGMFSGFEGDILFDQENPSASSVNVAMPVKSMITGWQARFDHLMSPDFFAASDDEMVRFSSTGIELTGETTARITGDLELNGITKPVVLEARLNKAAAHPMAKKDWAGFDATTMLKRSDFGVDMFAPFVSDEVEVMISIEAMKAE
ncbi:YceI family protein [Shimia sp.]|uniref:YceI family protein n=1 Tax=Shimia sp. TaxID=1954381 RepID=UPI00356A5FDF